MNEETIIPQHILAKEGVLTTFSIAKKITSANIKTLNEKIKSSKSQTDIVKLQEMLKRAIIRETKYAVETQKIPGLIINNINKNKVNNNTNLTEEDNKEKKRMMELTFFCNIIAKKLNKKDLSKFYRCFIINTLVNALHLTEEDFEEFHRKFAEFLEKHGDNLNDDNNE